MSLLPYFFDDFRLLRPSRILDQHFGMGLDPEDLLVPFTIPRQLASRLTYYRPWRTSAAEKDSGSTVAISKDKFQANLDVQHFAPEEISVTVSGNDTIVVEGNHEEKQDEHGYISRKFIRKYVLPKGHDVQKVESSLSSDGILNITVPKTEDEEVGVRKIPIQQTGIPSRSVEEKERSQMNETK